MPVIQSDYRAPSWAVGAHVQTIVPARISPRPAVRYRREHWDTPDGDFMLFDWAEPGPADPTAPILIHFHGLEGSSESHYAVALMAEAVRHGWRGCVPHYRSCGGELNRLPRAYFAGDSEDCDWVVRSIHGRYPNAPIVLAGMSLGGNYVAKYAGDMGAAMHPYVRAAAAVGAPLDLVAGSEIVSHGANTLYAKMFLATLREKVERKIEVFGDFIDVAAFRKVSTLSEFDEVYTAPVHGFKNGMDYWNRCSAKYVLPDVRVPLLLLNPLNDPFQPVWALPAEKDVSDFVFLEQPQEGGHIGFPTGKWPGVISWLPERLFKFFLSVIR
ncbi:MAG: alpha/beta hydrolase [Sutterellaceae bacterium]|nr:alpha/beta hydrolase [Sutterellaceae bacterium]MDD7442941.1 alpha/beta hydrolase [Sutterellaceae bacterium]MDY2868290.1 alpha/beta hydrolase [Mesosutterella sp.]